MDSLILLKKIQEGCIYSNNINHYYFYSTTVELSKNIYDKLNINDLEETPINKKVTQYS
jgi:hypothetical protein